MEGIRGQRALNVRLSNLARSLKDARPVFRKIAAVYERDFKQNMTNGVDPQGRPLAPVSKWTRELRAGVRSTGRMIPLVATGQLRNSIGAVDITADKFRFGFHGNQGKKAESMVYGIPGYMRVKASKIRTSRKGRKYVRYQYHPGRWATATDGGGKFSGDSIKITPKKRNFFYLSKEAQDKAEEITHEYIEAL